MRYKIQVASTGADLMGLSIQESLMETLRKHTTTGSAASGWPFSAAISVSDRHPFHLHLFRPTENALLRVQ